MYALCARAETDRRLKLDVKAKKRMSFEKICLCVRARCFWERLSPLAGHCLSSLKSARFRGSIFLHSAGQFVPNLVFKITIQEEQGTRFAKTIGDHIMPSAHTPSRGVHPQAGTILVRPVARPSLPSPAAVQGTSKFHTHVPHVTGADVRRRTPLFGVFRRMERLRNAGGRAHSLLL